MENTEYKFRDLKAEEIEVRIAKVTKTGLQLLLYKDARVDQNILDETVGAMNWERDHKELKGNIYCGISIWDETKKQWITKWDCGKESFSDAEKGEASDSFKRAGFNWGIGRELYTAPFIWVNAKDINLEYDENKKKYSCNDKFYVSKIAIKDKNITGLAIWNKTKKLRVYVWQKTEEGE